MPRWWLIAGALIASTLAAHAACDPQAANNVTATCTGVTVNQAGGPPGSSAGTSGYGTNVVTNLTTNVVSGATVTGTGVGIVYDTGAVFNAGTITGGFTGVGASTANVTNSGSISGGDRAIFGIEAAVANSGSLSGGDFGIEVINTANVINSGSISGGLMGIRVTVGTANVANSGSISGGAFGVSAPTANVTNSGSIFGGTTGINASASANVSNSGTIAGNTAIFGTVGNVTNSGTVIGTGGTAIRFAGNADTLTLLPGSRILGAIDMGGGADTVNIHAGRDVSWLVSLTNFTGTLNTFGPGLIAASGSQIATLDPTSFAMADRVLGDFTRGVSGVIAGRSGEAGTAGAPLALAPPDGLATWYGEMFEAMAYAGAPVFKAPTQVSREGTAVWARAFGGHRDHDGDDTTLPAISTFGGGAVGIDHPFAHGIRLGAFVGGGATRLNIAASSGGTDTDVLFGGVYGGWRAGNFFVDGALHAGHLDNRSTRRIASNLAPGGFETATASYDGWYLSPELGAGYRFALAPEWSLTPAARVRYVHADLDGYAETGSAANLTVAGRTLENLEERFDLTLSRRQAFATGDVLTTSVHAGVLGLHRLGGDTVGTVLLGVNLPFATPGEDNVAGLYAGAGFEWRLKPNVAFFGAGEAIVMSDDSTVLHGRGGLRVAF